VSRREAVQRPRRRWREPKLLWRHTHETAMEAEGRALRAQAVG
jgi:hypothetical protein